MTESPSQTPVSEVSAEVAGHAAVEGNGPRGRNRRLRVLFGTIDVASVPTRLALSLNEAGCSCRVVSTAQHPYHQQTAAGERLQLAAGLFRFAIRCERYGMPGRFFARQLRTTTLLAIALWATVAFDVVVIAGKFSFAPACLDQWVLRKLGKRIVRIYLGTDSRPRYMSALHDSVLKEGTRERATNKLAHQVKRQRQRLERAAAWADVVVDNPLAGLLQPRPFVNWFAIGFPHDDAFYPEPDHAEDHANDAGEMADGVRLLHSPSSPRNKGTAEIDAAIAQLQSEGTAIDYDRITGVPRSEVFRRLRRCDAVVDQLYSDTPLAGFASEAAAFGKPVVVGGYGWDELARTTPADLLAPSIAIDPADLVATLRSLVEDAGMRRQRGRALRSFVDGVWSKQAAAERFLRIVEGDIDPSWIVDPQAIDFWQGCGGPADHRRAVLETLARTHGLDALQLPPESPVRRTVAEWLAEDSSSSDATT